ncbi:MAG: hypothetical protein AW10_03022 [Candidatus Accumulibacter appositus]|uniref:Uncharacterized protein n=1 Tax=Candidatus Accumulibacter appositus TaxID=1454003 RepID=A0A011N7E7_9PROT|nr:MAG: hypothetical protein AW10_03022 [Candidatus Accumulibacter appositus]
MNCKMKSDGRKLDQSDLQVLLQKGLKAFRDGQGVMSVAAAYGVHVRSVGGLCHWPLLAISKGVGGAVSQWGGRLRLFCR